MNTDTEESSAAEKKLEARGLRWRKPCSCRGQHSSRRRWRSSLRRLWGRM